MWMNKITAVIRIIALSAAFFAQVVMASGSFTVSDIRIEGLQRESVGNVFAIVPVNIGDTVAPDDTKAIIETLFATGNFDDVAVGRDDDVLVVRVKERPSIGAIEIDGNKKIKTEDLLKGLTQAGLSEGNVFKRATLEGIRIELQRQYVAQGRYDAEIVAEVEALPRNRVLLRIDVYEGTVAKIKHLNIVGAHKFSQQELLDLLEMHTTGMWSWINSNDKYSRERLQADLEVLESFYRDQGYLKFTIESTQVQLSPERDAVFITINVSEGDIYDVSEIKLSGDIILDEDVIRTFILLKAGDTYSQRKVTASEEFITKLLGADGYVFAKVRHYPEINEENKTVGLTFFVDPGVKTYVNRIVFNGNTKTKDEVLRREMRLMESGLASAPKIDQSKVRLERLGFFKSVNSELKPVPGRDDLVDIDVNVEEQPSGSIGGSIGYSDSGGAVLSANVSEKNFFGTGKTVQFGVSRNRYQISANASYTNPYYTEDGVSRGFNVFYRETDFEKVGVAEYSTNVYGGNVNYSYPISETARLGFGFGYENIEIEVGSLAPQEIFSGSNVFLSQYLIGSIADLSTVLPSEFEDIKSISTLSSDAFVSGNGFINRNGDEFDNFTLTGFWQDSRLNRGFMPTKGWSQSLSFELGIPTTELEYFKINYRGQYFIPLERNTRHPEWSIRLHTRLGYGDGYGDLDELPFFENYYAGGFGSVRGYENSSLGPHGTPAESYNFRVQQGKDASGAAINGTQFGYVFDPATGKLVTRNRQQNTDPIGGNMLVTGGAELIFPLWFVKERRSLRTVLFVDVGNVFESTCNPGQRNCFGLDASELRASYGFGLTWVSALGPLSFSIARPINETEDDRPKFFQFSIGTGF